MSVGDRERGGEGVREGKRKERSRERGIKGYIETDRRSDIRVELLTD